MSYQRKGIKRTAIVPKEKQCKGSGRAVGYGCSKNAMFRTYGLCQSCYYRWLADSEEGQKMVKKVVAPIVKKRDDFKAASRDYEERKTIPNLIKCAVDAFHAYVRERDKNLNCISCSTPWMPSFQACHFLPAHKFPRLKFDEENVFGGCQRCNLYENGNESGYRIGLTERKGAEFVESLDEKARLDKLQGVHKWQREDLIRIRKYFTAKLALIKTKK